MTATYNKAAFMPAHKNNRLPFPHAESHHKSA